MKKLLAAAVLLAGLVTLLILWLIIWRPANTYYPYLSGKRAAAYERLRPLGFVCDLPRLIGARQQGSVFGLPAQKFALAGSDFEMGFCRNRLKGDFDIRFLGDDRAHIYEVQATSRGPVTKTIRERLAHAVFLAAGPERVSPELERWLRSAYKVDEEKETKRATATLLAAEATLRTVSIRAADGEAAARIPVRGPTPLFSPERLARTFAPTLRFHKDEAFRPLSLDALPAWADLCEHRQGPSVVRGSCRPFNALPKSNPCRSQNCLLEWVLDVRDADERHPGKYAAIEREIRARGSRPRVYFHVARIGRYRIVVQYWLYYLFNDFANQHEGDWETAQVDLIRWRGAGEVAAMRWFFSSHNGGEIRTCESTEDCHHPSVYIAWGSHANYFEPGAHKVGVLCNEQGRCVNIAVRKDHAQGDGERLTPDEYDLAPLEGIGYSGRYGRYNFHPGPDDHSAPTDPRRRTEWAEDPLDSFVKAPGQEPNPRHWYVIEID